MERQVSGNQRRLKLFRPNVNHNLRPLVQNTKKKLAQTLYYQNHPEHQSPLVRDGKAPVHQRLGVKQIRLKRIVPLGTNTENILPKKRFLRFPNRFKQNKIQRVYSAQARIERIRMQQRNNGTIKLRRLNRGSSLSNLTVEVKNPSFVTGYNGVQSGGFYKFKMTLDPHIQSEIEDIQRDSEFVELPPLTRIELIHITPVKLTDRFASL